MAKPAKIKPELKAEVQAYLLGELAEAKRFDQNRAKDREYADQLLRGQRLGEVPKGDPQVVSTDAADAIESVLPDILEIFNGGDDPVTIKPRTVKSRDAARRMAELIRYQLAHQLPWFKVQYTWCKDALAYRNGYLQWGWEFRYRWLESEYERLQTKDLEEILWDGGEVLEQGQPWVWNGRQVGWLGCRVRERVIIKNQPLVKPIPPGAFLMSPGASDIEDAPFAAVRDYPAFHRVKQEAQSLGYDLEGIRPGAISSDDETAARLAERGREDGLGSSADDPERGRVERHVCWFHWDLDGDGELEPAMATLINDKLVSLGPNPYQTTPVISISPILDTHQHEGVSLIDKVKEFQHIKTALYRAVIKMIRFATGPQNLVERDAGVDLNSLLRGQPFSVVHVDAGKLGAVKPLERPGMPAEVRWFAEWIEALKEQRVGVTRLNQGLEGKSLNDTARGMLSLMAKADKRIRLIARLFAEMGYKPLFRALIKLNQEFIDRDLVVALTAEAEEDTVFTPDELGGDFDLIVNVGLGNSDKALTVQQGQQLLQILTGLSQAPGGAAMVTPQNIYQLIKTIIDAMGWQSGLIITDPDQGGEANGRGGIQPAAGGIAIPGGAGAAGGGLPGQPGGAGVPGALPPGAAPGAVGAVQGVGVA